MFRANATRRNVKRAPSPFRPASDISGGPPTLTIVSTPSVSGMATMDKTFTNFLEAETASALLTKPWLRLERGLRLQKFRAFTESYPSLSDSEKIDLYNFLVRVNDSKQLNTKAQIQYENGMIQSVKGLKIIRTGDPAVPAVFKIEGVRQTKRNIN